MGTKRRKPAATEGPTSKRVKRRARRPGPRTDVHLSVTPECRRRLVIYAELLGTDVSEAAMDLIEAGTRGLVAYMPGLGGEPPAKDADSDAA